MIDLELPKNIQLDLHFDIDELYKNFLNLKSKNILSFIFILLYKNPFRINFFNSKFLYNILFFLSLFIQYIFFINNINYLSISPKTKSKVPIIVTKSAKNKPLLKKFNPYKWEKPGAFNLHLDGIFVPLETK